MADADRERRLARLLVEALGLPEGERDAFVDLLQGLDLELRASLRALLAMPLPERPEPDTLLASMRSAARAHLHGGWLNEGEWAELVQRLHGAPGSIERLKRGELVGETARCTVHAASDVCLHYRVAIKELRESLNSPPSDAQVRFVREIATMGKLRHPHIMPLIDYGLSSSGAPYFTTRLMEGGTLADLLAEARGPLQEDALAHYVALLRTVADAAHTAHAAGVVHRDIKPSNILLDQGRKNAFLGDWGIASECAPMVEAGIGPQERSSEGHWTVGQTMGGSSLGTLWYMSPEQARGEFAACDGRSDVYSLGAVLFEGLTGAPPYQRQKAEKGLSSEALRRFLGAPPRLDRPQGAPRELAAIAIMALAPDPAGRYRNARALAEDLGAWLEKRPVFAMGHSPLYRVRKAIQRRPGTSLLVGTVLLTIGVGLLWFSQTLRVKNARIESESVTSEALLDYMREVFDRANPSKESNRELKARDLLVGALDTLEAKLGAYPVAKARIEYNIGQNLVTLQDLDNAQRALENAYRVLWNDPAAPAHSKLEAAMYYGDFLSGKDPGESLEMVDAALEATAGELGEDHYTVLLARHSRARYLMGLGRLEESQAAAEALALRVKTLKGSDDPLLLEIYQLFATNAFQGGDAALAIERIEFALAESDRIRGPRHPGNGPMLQRLVNCYRSLENYARAEQVLLELVDFQAQHHGPNSPNTLVVLNDLGGLYTQLGRVDEALAIQETLYQGVLEAFGPRSEPALHTAKNYGASLTKAGRSEEAIAILTEVAEGWAELHGKGSTLAAAAKVSLARPYLQKGQAKKAEELCLEAKQALAELPPQAVERLRADSQLAKCLVAQERYEQALAVLQPALAVAEPQYGPSDLLCRTLAKELCDLLRTMGRTEALETQALAYFEACQGTSDADAARGLLAELGLKAPGQ